MTQSKPPAAQAGARANANGAQLSNPRRARRGFDPTRSVYVVAVRPLRAEKCSRRQLSFVAIKSRVARRQPPLDLAFA